MYFEFCIPNKIREQFFLRSGEAATVGKDRGTSESLRGPTEISRCGCDLVLLQLGSVFV